MTAKDLSRKIQNAPLLLAAPGKTMAPGLYLVSTPIGNLRDITLRALDVLAMADTVLCEDTRVTGRLLTHYGLKKKLAVYNDHSENKNHEKILSAVQGGGVVALVSDAGTPLISDPGYKLVQACVAAGITITSVPGPSAVTAALQLSGLPADAFAFMGFLPTKTGDRKKRLATFRDTPTTLIAFESAQRLPATLHDILDVLGDRKAVIARELTKLFEEIRRGTVSELLAALDAHPVKGEVVVLIDRGSAADTPQDWQADLKKKLKTLKLRQAVDDIAVTHNIPRRQVYDAALALKDQAE